MARLKNKRLFSKFHRLVGVTIFILILWNLDLRYILEQFKRMRLEYFLVAVAILVTFHAIKALRWRYILRLQGISYSFIHSYLVYLSGLFVGILTPGRVGDFIKIFYLKAGGVSTIKATFCSLVDRIADLSFLLFCGLLSLLWINQLLPIRMQLFWMIVLALLLSVLFTKSVGTARIKGLALKVVPESYVSLFEKGMTELKIELLNYSSWKVGILIAFTVIGWLLYFTVIFILTKGIGLSIPYFEVISFFIFSALVTFVPITVAGIGTRDLTLLLLFSRLGYAKEDAISFSFLILISYFLTALFGLIAWLLKPIRI